MALNEYEKEAWLQMPQGAMRPGGLNLTGNLLELATAKGLKPGSSICDVGCGTGSTVSKLNELGFLATGLDISQKLINHGKTKYPGIKLLCADATEMPFESGSFEAVISECSLSVMDTGEVLRECYRILKPEGLLLLSDVYVRNEQAAVDAGFYTKEQWTGLIENCGFSVIEFQDCSKAFTEFIIQAIWNFGSLDKLFDCQKWSGSRSRKLGYFLMLAVKEK